MSGNLAEGVWARRPITDTVIDAHAHAGAYSLFFIPDPSPAAMVRVMDRCGVDTAVLSSHLGLQLDATAGNRTTAAAVDAHPGRFAGYLAVNPWQDPETEIAAWAGDSRFVGVKLHPDLHTYPVTGDRYAPVWELARATGMPVLIHSWTGSPYNDPALIGAVAERHPDVVILMGHASGVKHGVDGAIEVAHRHPGVVLETCGTNITGRYVERMVGELGAAKVVFGSDFPFIDLRYALGRLCFARLSDADRRAVLGGTMTRLLAAAGQRAAGRSTGASTMESVVAVRAVGESVP